MTEADSGSPGTPNRIEVMSPNMIDTDTMPSKKAKASFGFMLKVNGSMSASVVGAEIPGRMPMMKPMRTPSIISRKGCGARTWVKPAPAAWTIVSTVLPPHELYGRVGGHGATAGRHVGDALAETYSVWQLKGTTGYPRIARRWPAHGRRRSTS